jgi:N-acetylmuramoyl-L-alanine amidase
VAILLPCISIPIYEDHSASIGHSAMRLLQVTQGNWEEPVMINKGWGWAKGQPNIWNVIGIAYCTGSLLLLIGCMRSLLYIRRISRRYPCEPFDEIKFFQTDERGAPFSFFRRIFWNRQIDLLSESGQKILRHELFHVRERHSLDIVFLESVVILCWINPFFHFIKKEIRAIHEFLADEAASAGSSGYDYAELLLRQSIRSKYSLHIHPFFQNQLKRRIMMITKWKPNKSNFGTRLMALPVLLILFCLFAFRIKVNNQPERPSKNITVIIDAGHGGSDAGAISANGSLEKDISLQIASKIQALSTEYNVTAILTRDKDELAGNTSDIHQSLVYRTALASQKAADLFLSIHVNADPKNPVANGFEIYVSDQKTPLQKRSIAIGSLLTENIKKDYTIADELKERSQGVYILRNATVPSVLLECGYITNERDEAFIKNEKNQDKIARDILDGIVSFQNKLANHTIALR